RSAARLLSQGRYSDSKFTISPRTEKWTIHLLQKRTILFVDNIRKVDYFLISVGFIVSASPFYFIERYFVHINQGSTLRSIADTMLLISPK
ncbi:MAG: hypothetical protein AB1401_14140, partial [Thermodesulfobacteriota bacterium]